MSHTDVFDDLSRMAASSLPRRQVFGLAARLTASGLAAALLAKVGIKPAWAARVNCICGGVPLRRGEACCRGVAYNVATQCCTPAGVQPMGPPLANVAACPGRVQAIPPRPPNGCGPGPPLGLAIPNTFPPVPVPGGGLIGGAIGFANFAPCCNTHDTCYDTCGTPQAACDGAFLICLRGACAVAFPPRFVGIGRFGFDVNLGIRTACNAAAGGYFLAVSSQSYFYDLAQAAVCRCCAGDPVCCPNDRVLCDGICCDAGEPCLPTPAGTPMCCPPGSVTVCPNDSKCCATPCDNTGKCPTYPPAPPMPPAP